jgi:CBS domain-containing protein
MSMKVREIMTRDVEACAGGTDLATAAGIMWRNDCGIVPVVEEPNRKVIGLITDRDICMACSTRNLRPSEITVEEVITGEVHACTETDDVKSVLRTMAERKVRRLPVLTNHGTLVGMLSISDVARHTPRTRGRASDAIGPADLVNAYRSICEQLQPA